MRIKLGMMLALSLAGVGCSSAPEPAATESAPVGVHPGCREVPPAEAICSVGQLWECDAGADLPDGCAGWWPYGRMCCR